VQPRVAVREPGGPRIVSLAPLRVSAAALGAFCLIAAIDEPTPLDRAVYDWAGRRYDRRLELAQRPIELFGLPGVYIPSALFLARQLRRKRRGGSVVITNAALAGWVALRLSRLVIHRPRPPRPPGRRPKSESTFPSGHTTGVTALAVAAAATLCDERMLKPREALLLGIGLPLATAATRVYTREHWLTDVLGGWALGLSAAMAVLSLRRDSTEPSSLRSSG
jgi:undecaprenyl-diphosphatase